MSMRSRPNILLSMADQHRADVLRCAGDPLCMPARASVLIDRLLSSR